MTDYKLLCTRSIHDLTARKARKNKARKSLVVGYIAESQYRGVGSKGSYSYRNMRGQV